jgi:flagellar motor switch protein FliN/FliY
MSARPELASATDLRSPAEAQPLVGLDSLVFRHVQVALRVRLGDISMTVEELLALKSGEVLKLDRALNEPVDLLLADTLVGRGEIVAIEDNFAVRLVEVGPK